jgi:hypothetical protein
VFPPAVHTIPQMLHKTLLIAAVRRILPHTEQLHSAHQLGVLLDPDAIHLIPQVEGSVHETAPYLRGQLQTVGHHLHF